MNAPHQTAPCSQCGLAPTLTLPVRRHVGMVIVQSFVKLEQPFCRDHGVAITKAFLRKTLVQGWWGLVSIFVNVFVVIRDLTVLAAYKRLDPPSGQPWPDRPGGVLPPMAVGEAREPAWHPDPMGRHELRWHDGAGWTARISDAGVVGIDPIEQR